MLFLIISASSHQEKSLPMIKVLNVSLLSVNKISQKTKNQRFKKYFMKVMILLLMIIITNEKKHQSSNDGSTSIDQKLKTSPQLFYNDTFANDATTCMFSQYPY